MSDGADVIVVGLGAMGSATAYQLAKRGVTVLGIDRFTPPHALGSTHGESRITRQAAGEGADCVPLVLRSHELWREIEAETGAELFTECGALLMRSAGGLAAHHGVEDLLGSTVALAERFGIDHEVLDGDEVRARYPALAVEGDYRAYFEPGGGFVRPEAAVSAQLDLARRHGAELILGERVTGITQADGVITVTAGEEKFTAADVVVTAGPWVGDLLADTGLSAPFKVYRQVLHWFCPDPDKAHLFSPDRFPVFIWTFGSRDVDYFYGFPSLDGGDVKVATENYTRGTDPETVDRSVSDSERREMFDRCVSGRIPALRFDRSRSTACMYTVTPDYKFVIDRHPAMDHVWVVSACSGHGFKNSAAIGEAMAQQVVDGRAGIDLSSFALGRFG